MEDERDSRTLQLVLVGIAPGHGGTILSWHGKEISHEVFILGLELEEHFAEPPQTAGLWVWEGIIEPPYLPANVEETEELYDTAVWTGRWRRPNEEELSWFGTYGRNPWEQEVS